MHLSQKFTLLSILIGSHLYSTAEMEPDFLRVHIEDQVILRSRDPWNLEGEEPFQHREFSRNSNDLEKLKNEIELFKDEIIGREQEEQSYRADLSQQIQADLGNLDKKVSLLLEKEIENAQTLESQIGELSYAVQRQNQTTGTDLKNEPYQNQIAKYRPSLNTHDIYTGIEYLFWKPYEQGTDYVVEEDSIVQTIITSTFQWGNVVEARFDWSSGFRVGAGYVCTPDYWDLEGEYTYAHLTGDRSVTADPFGSPPDFIYATIDNFTDNGAILATSEITIFYNTADLFLAKRLPLSRQILMRLVGGATGGWISQEWKIGYFGSLTTPPPITPGAFTKIQSRWEFQGGGFKGGLESDWLIGAGFSLLSKFKMALLFGYYENSFTRKEAFLPTTTPQTVIGITKLTDHRLIPAIQFAMGPSWGMKYSKCAIQLAAAYELNAWANLQEVLISDTSTGTVNARPSRYNQALLGMQGFSFRFQVNY